MRGKIAWVVLPHLGGMLSVYTTLSAGLRKLGWEVLPVWAGVSRFSRGNTRLDEVVEVLTPESSDTAACARALARWVSQRRCDILFMSGEPFALACLEALPERARVVAKCPAQSAHAYRLVTAYLARTDLILVETKRQHDDLTAGWRVPAGRCALIPNGVRCDVFRPPPVRDFNTPLRLVFLGRLDDATKHVMLLPEILRNLAKEDMLFEMSIVGDGPDRDRLQRRIDALGLSDRVTARGSVPRDQLPRLLGEGHIAVLPSRLDGMSWSLLESMSCGCVPVASLLYGTTDGVVRDGENGFLCRVGDAKAFARAIIALAGERSLLEKMSRAARRTIEDNFTSERMATEHDRAFSSLLNRHCDHPPPIPLERIQNPGTYVHPWRSLVPRPIKNAARTWAQRFGRTL